MSVQEDFVEKLSAALKYPSGFFYQEGVARTACESFYRRKKSGLSAGLLNECDARMNIKRLHVEKLIKAADFERASLPHLDPDEFEGGAREVARHLRRLWKVPRGPIKNLSKYVEDAGCVVVMFDFGTRKIDGVSVIADDGTPIIFLNKDLSPARLRLTLAHELGHIVMHRIPKPDMEAEAFDFGGELLMPEAEIRSSFYPLDLDRLARLKLYWQVSMAALLQHAKRLGAVNERYYTYLRTQMSRFGYLTQEPHEDLIEVEKPSLLRELIALHLGELEYSVDELSKSLSLLRPEFEEHYIYEPGELRALA